MLFNRIKIPNGLSVAFQHWNKSVSKNNDFSKRVICLHGWLDNSNSFSYLGPYLANKGYEVIAIDLIGHGFSDHYSPDSTLIHPNLLTHLRGVLVNLGWEKSNIIGHSMGAGASMMYAGCFPETVHKLVLIDGFGANTRPAATTSKQTRLAIEKELQFYIKHTPAILNSNEVSHSFAASPLGSKIYRNVEAAISARLNKLVTYPGTQTMSYEAAASIIKRGMMYADDKDRLMARVDQVASPSSSSSSTSTVSTYRHEEVDTKSDRPVVFSHDPRLYLPSYTSMTVEHLLSYISSVTAPTLIVKAEHGWPFNNQDEEDKKLAAFQVPVDYRTLPGSHHLHLDPLTAPATADVISEFLSKK